MPDRTADSDPGRGCDRAAQERPPSCSPCDSATVKILNESGGAVSTYGCGGALGPGQFCSLSTAIASGVAYACSATAGSTGNLRGASVIQELLPDGFGSSYLRAIRSSPLR